jgi:hypothetical protein
LYPRPFPDSVVPPHHPDDVAEGKYRPSLEHLHESVARGLFRRGWAPPPTQITSLRRASRSAVFFRGTASPYGNGGAPLAVSYPHLVKIGGHKTP